MFPRTFLLLLFLVVVNVSASVNTRNEDVFSIGFLLEQQQQHVPGDISTILNELETATGHKIEAHFITINRQNSNETMNMLCKTLYKGISIFLDLSYASWEEGVNLINTIQIQYLKVDISIAPFLNIMENYLLARGDATDSALIFQNEQELNEALYYIVKGSQLRVILVNGNNGDFTEKIKRLRPIPSYYALFAKTTNMNIIFNKILDAKVFSRPDRWHLFHLDFNSEDFQYMKHAINATKISPNHEKSCFSHDNFGTCEIPGSVSFPNVILKEIISKLTQKSEIPTLLRTTWNCENQNRLSNVTSTNNDVIDETLESQNILSLLKNSNILTVLNEEITLQLNMTMQIYVDKPKKYNNTATWTQGQIKTVTERIAPARRFFRIGTAEAIPWSYIHRDPITGESILDDDGNAIWTGYCIDVIDMLAKKMDFDYELIIPKKGTFGKRLLNGKWDGLIGDLMSGETDIAVAALKMTSDREEVIDFIAPYFEQTGISIVIRKAVRQTSLFKFMTVLRLEVWLSIIASLVATAIMIWLLDKYSPYSARNNKTAYPYPCREFTLKESFWFALTSFTPQGGGEAPKAISARTLVAAYWLFVVLMLATFTANLAAFLTVERMQTPVQSLEQLARQSRINYTVVEGSDTHKHFINMKYAEDTLYRMWKELTLNATTDETKYRIWDYPIKEQYGHILLAINGSNPVKDATEGFRKVNEHENADFAFIHDSAEIKYEISRNCNLTEVGEVFAEQPYAIAIQQGSNLQDELSYAILEFQKDRYLEGLTAKYWNNSNNKECSGSEDNEGITLESLGGVFIATLFGLALAMLTLVGEIIYYRRKDSKLKENKVGDNQMKINVSKELPTYPITPPPPFDRNLQRTKQVPTQITFGDQFIPSKKGKMKVSYIPVQPRNSIHDQLEYFE